ncbi:MAG: HYR domain-containing protein, partial [Saprospiraceae bacterium]|nr:HYR domain-containing protein [Saprospiraceae bacterium]
GNLARTFKIYNTGNAALNISSITSDNVKFVVSGTPTSVAANDSATFTVTFNPTALGAQNATITVNTNDCDEAVYDFAVTGKGATPASALHFDGANDNVSIPNHAALQLDQFTLETWFNPSTAADFPALPPALIAKGAAGSPDYFMVPMFNSRKIAAGFWSGASFVTVLSTTDLAQNTWYHLAATFDGTTLKMYVNGVLENTVAAAGLHPQVTTNALSLGLTNTTQYVNGALDEVRIWNVARSCEEIRQLRNCELAGSEGGLVAYYKFNQGFANENNSTVTTLADAATGLGGANDGTLAGFTLGGLNSNWVAPGGVTTGTSCPAMVTYPEADVLGHDNTPLADGTTSTSVAQGTNLGSVNFGSSSAAKTFTIQNNGTTSLNVTSIASSDPQFAVTALSPASPIPDGIPPATFTITFTPTATGVQNATITIENDDCDEAVYTFAVTGTGVCIPPSFSACPTGPLTASAVTGTCAAPVNYTVTEAGNPAPTVTYAFTGATTGSGSGTGTGSTFNKGNTTVTVTATSSCSPPATCSFTVTVTDNEKPQITCAGPVTINTTSGLCTGTTTLTPPTGTDNCEVSGNALSFDGVDDFVEATTFTAPFNFASQTLEAWVNPALRSDGTALNQFPNMILSDDIPGFHGRGFGVVVLNSGVSGILLEYISGFKTISYPFVAGNWYHVSVVYTPSSIVTYVNGAIVDNFAVANSPSVLGGTRTLKIGKHNDDVTYGTRRFFSGGLDEIRVWNVARSQAEIQADMSYGVPTLSGIQALYHANQGTGGGTNTGLSTLIDDSGNGRNGTMSGFALTGSSSNWVANGAPIGIRMTSDAPATFPKGPTTVTWTGTDLAGNTETCQQTVTVTDNEAPVLTVPAANIPLNVIATTCAANYTIASPISDNCMGATWTYALSGATTAATSSAIADGIDATNVSFNKGVTTVTLNGVDAATNTAVQKTFTVTVTDDEKPQITCTGPVTVNTTPGLCTGTATLPAPTVTDNCPFGGNGLNFDGSNDQLATAAYSGTALTGDLTLECWFKGTSLNGRALIGRGFQQEFDLALWSNQLSYYHGNGSTYTEVNFNYVFTDNTWYHVAVVRNAVAQTVSLYVNGVFQQTLAYGTPLPVAQSVAFRIGHRAAGQFFSGSMDEVRVWTVARTPAQIAANWNKELAAQPDLFALYHLNEGVANADNSGATTAADASGNTQDGTLTNFALSGTTSNWVVGAFGGVTNNAPATYPKGNTTVTWTATDASGNTETCQQTVTVTDNEPPTITCPTGSPFTRNTDATECTYTVQGTEFNPTFGDNCPGATISNSFNSMATLAGADLPKGSTTITWTVTDGMAMSSTTCAIVVTVSDNQMPTITCPSGSPFARNTDATECTYTVQGTEFNPTAFGDNCPGATISNSFNNMATLAGTDLPKGSTTITWTVTDDMAMSSTTCAIVVNVTDNQMPTITCATAPPVFTSTYGASTFIGIFNGKAYFDIATGVGNFLNLNAEAVAAGGYITTIETAAEQNFLAGKQTMGLISGLAGIGLYGPKPYLDNDWIGPATSYRAFHPSEPTGASGYVGLYSSYSGLWIDHNTMTSLIVELPATGNPFARNTDATECTYTVQGTEFNPTAFGDNCPGATISNSFNNMASLANADLPKGSTTITWTVTDGMAMSSTTCAIVVTVSDNQMPTITCPTGSPFARDADANECNYTVQGTEFDPTAFGDNCPGATISNSFNSMASLAGADLPKGSTTITWTVTDGMAMSSTTCAIVVNVQFPEISVRGNGMEIADGDAMPDPADHTDFGSTTGTPITRTFTIKNTGNVNLNLGAGAITISGPDMAMFTVNNITLPTSIAGPLGSVTFDVTYTPVGIATHTATVNIVSNDCDETTYDFAIQGTRNCSPPSFTDCPTSPIVVNTDAGQCNAVVNYTVTADGTPAPDLTYMFSGVTTGSDSGTGSGETFSKGSTIVTVTATNPCGMPTCMFTVTVSDMEKPTLADCPSNIVLKTSEDGGADCAVEVTYAPPTFSDNCDGTGLATWVSGPISGASLHVSGSPYTVVYTKTDAAGNAVATDCSFTVTVQDDTKPTLADCPSNIVLKTSEDGGADCAVEVTYTAPTFSDNCDGTGTATWVSGPTSGTSLNVSGTPYTVVYTKTDAAGNAVATDCSFTVTVQDDTKPTLADCPSNIVLKTSEDGGADCAVEVTYAPPTFSDNCDGTGTATWVSGPMSGTSLHVSGSPYTVVYTKTDAAGNAVLTDCSFTVTVQDDTKPTLTCPSSNTLTPLSGNCTYTLSGTAYDPTGLSDNCGVAGVSNDFNNMATLAGAVLPTGANLIEWTVTDVNGLINTCQFTLTVTACVEISGAIFWKGDGVAG